MSYLPCVGFDFLPLEVIEQIASYLSTNDMLACSSVSVGWREALNNNILWVKRCKGGYGWDSYAQRLQNQKCVVEPFFELPQNSEETLEPLCKWRVNLMTQIHFRQNLEKKRYKKYTVEGNFNTDNTVYYEAENIVILFSGSNSCEVWNTENEPFCEEIIYCALDAVKPFLYVFDNLILILQFNLIQVYEKTDNKYKLLHLKLFDINEVPVNFPTFIDSSGWYIDNSLSKSVLIHPFRNRIICFKNIFIGYNGSSDLTNCIFNIWDFKNGIKVKEEKFLSFPNLVWDIDFYKTKDLVYIIFETKNNRNRKQSVIVGYDALTQNYTKLRIFVNSSIRERYFFFEKNYVLALHSNKIIVWDITEENKSGTCKDLDTSPFPYALCIHNSNILYAGNDMFANFLTILDIKTLQKIKVLKVPCPIYRLMNSESNMLLMKCNISDFYNFTRDVDEYEVSIWDLECCTSILSFRIIDQFSGYLNYTKVISIQPRQLVLIHFW